MNPTQMRAAQRPIKHHESVDGFRAKFDVSELFQYYRFREAGLRYADTIKEAYQRAAACRLCHLTTLLNDRVRSVDYVFVGKKYGSLIKALSRDARVLIIGNLSDWKYAKSVGARYFSKHDSVQAIASYAEPTAHQNLIKSIRAAESVMRRWNPKAIVVANDYLPVERFWIAAARLASIPSVCIQHGLFSESGGQLNDGKYADLIMAYDSYQASVLKKTGARATYEFGYFEESWPQEGTVLRNSEVCILGQPWIDYYPNKTKAYLVYLSAITKALSDSGFRWYYKPHPSEQKYSAYMLGHATRLFTGPLPEALGRFDVFVSLNSTALLEATLRGKLAIQVRHPDLATEDLSVPGYAYSLDIHEAAVSLPKLIGIAPPRPNPINVSPLAPRFREAVDHVRRATDALSSNI